MGDRCFCDGNDLNCGEDIAVHAWGYHTREGCREWTDGHRRALGIAPFHDHDGFAPYSGDCIRCVQQSMSFNNEVADGRERELKREIERLQDAWFQDDGIAPDGNLRALVSRTVERAAAAESLLFKIHKLSDPNRSPAAGPPSSPGTD